MRSFSLLNHFSVEKSDMYPRAQARTKQKTANAIIAVDIKAIDKEWGFFVFFFTNVS